MKNEMSFYEDDNNPILSGVTVDDRKITIRELGFQGVLFFDVDGKIYVEPIFFGQIFDAHLGGICLYNMLRHCNKDKFFVVPGGEWLKGSNIVVELDFMLRKLEMAQKNISECMDIFRGLKSNSEPWRFSFREPPTNQEHGQRPNEETDNADNPSANLDNDLPLDRIRFNFTGFLKRCFCKLGF